MYPDYCLWLGHCVLQGRRARLGPNRDACMYFADVSTFFFGMFSVVLRGCSVLTSFLLSLQVLFYFLGGVHMLLLLKGWMADLFYSLSKLSRDSDSDGYGVVQRRLVVRG